MMQEVWSFRVGRPCKQRHNRGDHDKARRTVGERIGVDTTSVFNSEANAAEPEIRCMPAIIRFLGYNPQPPAKGWGERLVRQRTTLGLSQKDAALKIGVDPGTLARWERGEREPAGVLLGRVEMFLDETEALCQEGAKASCCTKDEGGPFGAAL